MLSGRELAVYCCDYVKKHPDRFKKLMHISHTEVDRGAKNLQRGDIYYLAKKLGMNISDIEDLKRDNNLWPGLTRYMVMLRPRLARVFSFRKSKLDDIDLIEIWRERVDPNTTFLANSWQEAKRNVEMDDITTLPSSWKKVEQEKRCRKKRTVQPSLL